MLYVVLLVVLAVVSIFSFRKYMNGCEEVEFSTIMNKEFAFVDNNTQTNITLVFSEDGRVLGFSGVNKYFAAYKLDENNQITLSSIGTTMNTASEEEIKAERSYIEMLSNVTKVKACKDKLLLTEGDKTLNFVPTGKEVTEVVTDVNAEQNTTETNVDTTTNETQETEVVNPQVTEEVVPAATEETK